MAAQVYFVEYRKDEPWELDAKCDVCGMEHCWRGNDIRGLWKAVKEWGWVASTGWMKAKLVKCPDCLDRVRDELRSRAKQRRAARLALRVHQLPDVAEARGAVAGPLPGEIAAKGLARA